MNLPKHGACFSPFYYWCLVPTSSTATRPFASVESVDEVLNAQQHFEYILWHISTQILLCPVRFSLSFYCWYWTTLRKFTTASQSKSRSHGRNRIFTTLVTSQRQWWQWVEAVNGHPWWDLSLITVVCVFVFPPLDLNKNMEGRMFFRQKTYLQVKLGVKKGVKE